MVEMDTAVVMSKYKTGTNYKMPRESLKNVCFILLPSGGYAEFYILEVLLRDSDIGFKESGQFMVDTMHGRNRKAMSLRLQAFCFFLPVSNPSPLDALGVEPVATFGSRSCRCKYGCPFARAFRPDPRQKTRN